MRDKFVLIFWYLLDRLQEASTWQALSFIGGFCGAHWLANIDAGGAAACGGLASAIIKGLFPDGFTFSHLFKGKP